jgi:hypothetical protein
MARRHGKNGQVRINASGGSPTTPVASLNKWSLSLATDKSDVTAFGDTNKVYVTGLPDIKGNIAGVWDSVDTTIFDVAVGTVPAELRLVPSTLDSSLYFEGLAYLDANIDVDAKGNIAVGSSFVAAASWHVP